MGWASGTVFFQKFFIDTFLGLAPQHLPPQLAYLFELLVSILLTVLVRNVHVNRRKEHRMEATMAT
jgi:hypothetical protein